MNSSYLQGFRKLRRVTPGRENQTPVPRPKSAALTQLSEHIGVALCVTLALLALSLAPASHGAPTQSQAEQSLIAAVNDVRAAHNLRPLKIDAHLVEAARDHSSALLRTNVFEHGSFAERLALHGARGPAFGENLAWGTGRLASAQAIVSAWMVSPGHRANLLRPGWSRIGVGTTNGRFLGHRGAIVVTADFAGR
jgi:uncharacterized protein YkwD